MQTEQLLFDHVLSMPTGLPVAFPGVMFEKPSNNRYIEVIHFPNDPIDYDWRSNATVQRGILQINVHWSRNVGIVDANDVARTVAQWFAKNTVISNSLMIINPPSIGQWIDSFIPIRIFYRSVNHG